MNAVTEEVSSGSCNHQERPVTTVGKLFGALRLPVICAPMFIVSNPQMLIEQCKSGIVGSLPALNARPQGVLAEWLSLVTESLQAYQRDHPDRRVAPFAVNLVLRKLNDRLAPDLDVLEQFKVPLVITSLSSPAEVVKRVHAWGGVVFHDVTTARHARKAIDAGVDGLILVAAGAGGHAGGLSPFALLNEVRAFYDGPLVLAGSITNGRSILSAQVMGADYVYMGSRFIATQESSAVPEYKHTMVRSTATDIIYTPYFSGISANYLKPSIVAAGLDPDNLPANGAQPGDARSKRWKDIWGCGQGVGDINDIPAISDLVDRLCTEYEQTRNHWAQVLHLTST